MAYTDYLDQVQSIYIAYYGRPADPEGLQYWAERLDAENGNLDAIIDAFGTSAEADVLFGGMGYEETVNTLYNQMFGRDADQGGLDFYVGKLTSGEMTLVSIAKNIFDGAQNDDAAMLANKLAVADRFTGSLDDPAEISAYAGDDAAVIARDMLATVDADTNPQTFYGFDSAFSQITGGSASNLFTLTESVVPGEAAVAPVTAVYWGYNPHGHNSGSVDNGDYNNDTNEGPLDGGIPVADLVSFLTSITGQDFFELGLIDEEFGTVEEAIDRIKNITINDVTNGDGSDLTIELTDGDTISAEASLGEDYLEFLNNLLFDAEGNSRLYEKTIVEGQSAGEDSLQPIILTPAQNNGGTEEQGFTTASDDTIVAGRLELLHGAYIDGGGGYNILEVDAKGIFAQPKELLNIQEVRVENLPNIYTFDNGQLGDGAVEHGNLDNSTYSFLTDSVINADSVLDLSRATSIEKLVVTEGSWEPDFNDMRLGDLTIVGIRNGVTTTLDGGFSEDVTLHYSEIQDNGVSVVFSNLNMNDYTETGAQLNIAHNSDTLNIESTGGGNWLHNSELGGRLSNLNITGDAHLYIQHDLDTSFHDESPVTIDASANTGGVTLNLTGSQNVTFYGSEGDDIFLVRTSEADELIGTTDDDSVTIVDGGGNNHFEVDTDILNVTLLDGNTKLEVEDAESITIMGGDGDNHFQFNDGSQSTIVLGDGNNRMEIHAQGFSDEGFVSDSINFPNEANITVGAGQNVIDVDLDSNIGEVTVVAGDGGNDIDATAHSINITTGSSADVVKVLGDILVINSGGGGDTITVGGFDLDYVGTDVLGGNALADGEDTAAWGDDGALVQINAGADATIILGSDRDNVFDADNDFPGVSSITALSGSFIAGENVSLVVKTVADLRAAVLTGVTSVELDDDSFDLTDAPLANDANGGFNSAVLTLTSSQFLELGAENFSVDGAIFNTHAFVKIIVDESTSLTDLGVDSLPRNIDLLLEVQDGATLTMTAEQLHTRVAQNGVTLANDGNTDYANGSVIITGGGQDFDPFNTSDTIQSVVNGTLYTGGSLSSDFMSGQNWYNVQVDSYVNGWDRPADVSAEISITLDSTGDATLVQGAFDSWHTNLEIVGDQDIDFTGAVSLGMLQGVPTFPFNIDFAALEGVVNNFVVDNFELLALGGSIVGNADNGYASEVLISIADDDDTDGVGFDAELAGSLVSSGVSRYVVTTIDGPTANGSPGNTATILLCDTAQDIDVFALRGNYNDTLNIVDAAWGLQFELQGGGIAKAEGPTGTSNVGSLRAGYEWPGADAVVTLTHSVEGDTRPISTDSVWINNADSIEINADASATTISTLGGSTVTSLDVNSEGSVTINNELPVALTVIDASDVAGGFTATIDNPDGDFVFTGGAGADVLHLQNIDVDEDTTVDGGSGGVTLVIDEDETVDLSAATLINVTSVVLEDDADLTLTMDQADVIGSGNFVIADGDDADLMLLGLSDQTFSLANYDSDITIMITIAALPEVTLNAATDLTGISGLEIPEGTVLNMTAAQFQQLNGDGTITGQGSLHITDMTQSDVGVAGEDFSLADVNLDSGADGVATVTISLAESVDLSAATVQTVDGNIDTFNFGDDLTLTLGDISNADAVAVVGGTNSTLKFTDMSAGMFETIDASGFKVDQLMVLNILVADRNVDLMFMGLPESVTKVIYTGVGWVEGVDQFVVLEEGVTVPGFLVFNKPEADVEIQNFTLTMSGGTEIDGNLRLSASLAEAGQMQMDLQSVTINSLATVDNPSTEDIVEGANRFTGETTNIITGDITSQGTGYQVSYTSVDNDLLNVTINAEENFILQGDIIFESVTGNDNFTANDDDEATAVLNVNGDADVTIEGGLDISDNDVEFLVVNHTGLGSLDIRLDGLDFDSWDEITINGSADGMDILRIANSMDLSDDTLVDVDQILLEDGSNLTLTFDQYDALGSILGLAQAGDNATISIVSLDNGDVFDATLLPTGITVASITVDEGNITLDPATNLTNVGQIEVPEGSTLNLTAAQYQQLQGTGTIVGIDSDGDTTVEEFFVNITDLTQADVDYDTDGDGTVEAGESLNLSLIGDEATVNVSLAEDVYLNEFTELSVNGTDYDNVKVLLADGQIIGLATFDQADGLNVTGGVGSTIIFQFDDENGNPTDLGSTLDASGYAVDFLRALNLFVGGLNVEYLIDDLASSVTLVIYHDPKELGFLSQTNRVVIVEESVTVPDSQNIGVALGFNDLDLTDEVISLTMYLNGGVELDGDIRLGTTDPTSTGLQAMNFMELNLISQGTAENLLTGETANVIDGDITPVSAGPFETNDLRVVNIEATQDLEITGTVVFRSEIDPDNTDVEFNMSGDADVTIKSLDTTDVDIDTLNINNLGTGTLTITGGSDALELNDTESLVFTGTGDIVLDTDAGAGNNGIEGDELSLIDASGLSGDLTLGVIEDIDSQDFAFISGTGVTTMTLAIDTLNADVTADPVETGWSFDFTDAAVGSEFHIGDGVGGNAAPVFTQGPLNINLGPNTTLYINEDTDLTGVDLTIDQTLPIVLADNVTLYLTAAQASGLDIVEGVDVGGDGIFNGKVVITDLGAYTDLNLNGSNDDPAELFDYDFSGIAVPASATLFDNDVTISSGSDLGDVSITLTELADDRATSLAGQTIRFNTEAQAARTINVDETINDNNNSSTNVIWLFDSITDTVDTSGYDQAIGRLWLTEALANGANIEDLFTSLPNTILRVDFATLAELESLLVNAPVDRIIELASFVNLPDGLTFSDQDQLESVETLTINMGGEVTVGDIVIDNVIDNLGVYQGGTPTFDSLTINSVLADDTGDLLATEGFDEEVNVKPVAANIVGDISVGTENNIDLLSVTLNTGDDLAGNNLAADDTFNTLTGNDLIVGTITFDSDDVLADTATLVVTGENDVTIKSLDTSDPEITVLDIDDAAHTGDLTITGGSPAAAVSNTEIINIMTGAAVGVVNFGTAFDDVNNVFYAGVAGADLSEITVTGAKEVNLGVLALIDGSDDDSDDDGIPDVDAFTLNGNGNTTATLGEANVDGSVVAPTLETGSTWAFNNVDMTITEDVTFEADSNLILNGVILTIEGDVDASDINVSIDAASEVYVPAGNSLTLTLEQLAAAPFGVEIHGEGTVLVVGEIDTDALVALDLAAVRTVGIDLSGITNAGVIVPQANPVEVTLDPNGAMLDDGTTVAGFNVVGTPFIDDITGTMYDDTLNGAAGNDTLTGGDGSDTFLVTSGTDTITDLYSDDPNADPLADPFEQDVLVVSAGAIAEATVDGQFFATAATSNAGTANLTAAGVAGEATIDLTLAGGPNGYNLIGDATDNVANTLIGSAFADTINGGNVAQDSVEDVDVLTGNGGADVFVFDIDQSTPLALTPAVSIAGLDEEVWGITVAGVEDNLDSLTVTYTRNSLVSSQFTIFDDATIDFSNIDALGTRLAQEFSNRAMSATWDDVNDLLTVTGTGGSLAGSTVSAAQSIEIVSITGNGGDVGITTAEEVTSDDNDTAQITTVTVGTAVGDLAVAGEVYTLEINAAEFAGASFEYEAQLGDTALDVADGLIAAVGGVFAGVLTLDNTGGTSNVITITDDVPEDGGFNVTTSVATGIQGTSASALGAGGGTWANAFADIITDFTSGGVDTIQLGIANGINAINYVEAAEAADYNTAYTAANLAFDGTIRYYLTSATDLDGASGTGLVEGQEGAGLLFFDANGNGSADGVIALLGVTASDFAATDIVL